MSSPVVDLSFPHAWQAEILPSRPVILPSRRYVYPREVEEIERGALEVLVRPDTRSVLVGPGSVGPGSVGPGFSPDYRKPDSGEGALAPAPAPSQTPQPFLATCAVGFLDPVVPNGIWSCPNPCEICAVSGGYAYLIDTLDPERFTMIAFRPVLEVRPAVEAGLLLFVGHYSIIAWGKDGHAWQSEKLSDEGVTITAIESGVLRGLGWRMMTDRETAFAVDLATGSRI